MLAHKAGAAAGHLRAGVRYFVPVCLVLVEPQQSTPRDGTRQRRGLGGRGFLQAIPELGSEGRQAHVAVAAAAPLSGLVRTVIVVWVVGFLLQHSVTTLSRLADGLCATLIQCRILPLPPRAKCKQALFFFLA